jgi:hypothetical protein
MYTSTRKLRNESGRGPIWRAPHDIASPLLSNQNASSSRTVANEPRSLGKKRFCFLNPLPSADSSSVSQKGSSRTVRNVNVPMEAALAAQCSEDMTQNMEHTVSPTH